MILDPDTKLIVSLVVGRRNADTVVQVFTDFYGRTGGYLPELICTDEYAVYEAVILDLSRRSRNQRGPGGAAGRWLLSNPRSSKSHPGNAGQATATNGHNGTPTEGG